MDTCKNIFDSLEVEAVPFDGAMLSPSSSTSGNDSVEGTPDFCNSVGSRTPTSVSPKSRQITPAARKLAKDLDLTPDVSPCMTNASLSPVDTVWRDSPMPARRNTSSMKASIALEEAETYSPHATPVADAVLSPMSQAKAARRMERLARDNKVAVAFSLPDFADDKNDSASFSKKMMLLDATDNNAFVADESDSLIVQENIMHTPGGSLLPSNDRGACLLHRQRATSLLVPLSPCSTTNVSTDAQSGSGQSFIRFLQIITIVISIYAAACNLISMPFDSISSYQSSIPAEKPVKPLNPSMSDMMKDVSTVSVLLPKLIQSEYIAKTEQMQYLESPKEVPIVEETVQVSIATTSTSISDMLPKDVILDTKSIKVSTNSFFTIDLKSASTEYVKKDTMKTSSPIYGVSSSPYGKKRQRVHGITYRSNIRQNKKIISKKRSIYNQIQTKTSTGNIVSVPDANWQLVDIRAASSKAKKHRVGQIVIEMKEMMHAMQTKSSHLAIPGGYNMLTLPAPYMVDDVTASVTSLLIPATTTPTKFELQNSAKTSCFYQSGISSPSSHIILGSLKITWTAQQSTPSGLLAMMQPWPRHLEQQILPTVPKESIAVLSLPGAPHIVADEKEVIVPMRSFATIKAEALAPALSVKLVETETTLAGGIESNDYPVFDISVPVAPALLQVHLLRYKRQYQGPIMQEPVMVTHTSGIYGHIDALPRSMDTSQFPIIDIPITNELSILKVNLVSVMWSMGTITTISSDYTGKVTYVSDLSVPLMPVDIVPQRHISTDAVAEVAKGDMTSNTGSCPRIIGGTKNKAYLMKNMKNISHMNTGVYYGPPRSIEMIRKAFKDAAAERQQAESVDALGLLFGLWVFLQAFPAVPLLAFMKGVNRCTGTVKKHTRNVRA
jgi:hypothetical protein